jgi:hypothetical protein
MMSHSWAEGMLGCNVFPHTVRGRAERGAWRPTFDELVVGFLGYAAVSVMVTWNPSASILRWSRFASMAFTTAP